MPQTRTSGAGHRETSTHQGPPDWSIQGAEETGKPAQGARTGASRKERAGKQPDWSIRGAVDRIPGLDHPGTKGRAPDWSVRGCIRRRRRQKQAAKANKIKGREPRDRGVRREDGHSKREGKGKNERPDNARRRRGNKRRSNRRGEPERQPRTGAARTEGQATGVWNIRGKRQRQSIKAP